jgi:hypothetical protein
MKTVVEYSEEPKQEVNTMYGIFTMRYKRTESNTFISSNIKTTEMEIANDTLFESEEDAISFLPVLKNMKMQPIGMYLILPIYII